MIYFRKDEFMMGKEEVFDKMDKSFLTKLDILRGAIGEPLFLTSTYRSPDYNEKIGGASRSKHMEGIAADISCNNSTLRMRIVKEALRLGLTVGVAKTFIHVDNRDAQILFTY